MVAKDVPKDLPKWDLAIGLVLGMEWVLLDQVR